MMKKIYFKPTSCVYYITLEEKVIATSTDEIGFKDDEDPGSKLRSDPFMDDWNNFAHEDL